MNSKTDLFNCIIDKRQCQTYLEIGIDHGHNFKSIKGKSLKLKIGVDPNPQPEGYANFIMTSDKFFKTWSKSMPKFDLVHIDGLHLCQQVYKDIVNSIFYASPSAVIICHDILPSTEERQVQKEWKTGDPPWNGDCWKAFAKHASESDFKHYTLDFDEGLGVIDLSKRCGEERPAITKTMEEMTWDDYVHNKDTWLNIKPKEFAYLEFGSLDA